MIRTIRTLIGVALVAVAGTPVQALQARGAPPGTLALANLPEAARSAYLRGVDAYYTWEPLAAYRFMTEALAADSTFGLARTVAAFYRGGPTVAAEGRRATADAVTRPVPEQTVVLANRAAGVNRVRLLTAARAMMPNDHRLAYDHAIALTGGARIDSLRALSERLPDEVAPKLWLAYYLTLNAFPVPTGQVADEALSVAQAAVRQAPDMGASHAALGHVLERLGRHEEALTHLDQATRLTPDLEWAFVLKAEIHAREGRTSELRAALESAAGASPHVGRQVDYRESRSIALLNEGRAREAMEELTALAREAESKGARAAAAGVHQRMAVLSAGTRDNAAIDAHFTEAQRLGIAEATLADGRVVAYFLAGRAEDVRRALVDYIRLNSGPPGTPPNANIRRMTGLTLVTEGKVEEAIAELRAGGDNPFAQLGMIEAYLRMGRTADAQAERVAMLRRMDTTWNSIAVPIARYRGLH
jgi:tetratricopeptide (TPR) repeat protein